MGLFGHIAGAALRTAAARERRRFEAVDPVAAQRAVLRGLLARAADTRFGRDHRFSSLDGVAAFQAAVPLRSYEDFYRDYWGDAWPRLDDLTWPGRIPFFALTSGTTAGPSKRIPVSREMIAANARAGRLTLAWHYHARPDSALTSGKTLMLGGSTAFETPAPDVSAGDLSGLATVTQPWYTRALSTPGRAEALMSDWDAKLARLADIAVSTRITGLTGTPAWTLPFLDAVAARRGPGAPLPDLALYVHGGMGFAPYATRLQAALGGVAPDLREVFPASEGFIALQDARPEDGLRLLHDNGLFFEFIRPQDLGAERPERRWLGTAETGVDYALAVSTNAGLWAYLLGDVIRFTSLDPPRLVVAGRTKWTLSTFGEHVIAEELEKSALAGAAAVGAALIEVSAAPDFPSSGETAGRHVIAVELTEAGWSADQFGAAFDAALSTLNDDYRAKRAGDRGLRPPVIRAIPPGGFDTWMRRRGKLGGQHKAPRVVADPDALPPPDHHEP